MEHKQEKYGSIDPVVGAVDTTLLHTPRLLSIEAQAVIMQSLSAELHAVILKFNEGKCTEWYVYGVGSKVIGVTLSAFPVAWWDCIEIRRVQYGHTMVISSPVLRVLNVMPG